MPGLPNANNAGLLSRWLQDARFRLSARYVRGEVLDFGAHHGRLTDLCVPAHYLGVEHDPIFLDEARRLHPEFAFVTTLPTDQLFDTVAALAVIEHVKDPGSVLADFTTVLKPGGRIVLTTPHPRYEWIHTVGAKVGLFSHHAHDDHEDLLDHAHLERIAVANGLVIETYQRFLLGANQLFVLRRTVEPAA